MKPTQGINVECIEPTQGINVECGINERFFSSFNDHDWDWGAKKTYELWSRSTK